MLQAINYFFVPALAVLLHERAGDPALKPSVRLLAVYLTYTAAIIPCTRVMTSVLCRLFGGDIPVASPEYTLFALLAAGVLPGAVRLARETLRIELLAEPKSAPVEEKKRKRNG